MSTSVKRLLRSNLTVGLLGTMGGIVVGGLFFLMTDREASDSEEPTAFQIVEATPQPERLPLEVAPVVEPPAESIAPKPAATDTRAVESPDGLEPCPNERRAHIRLFRDAQVRPTYPHRTMLGVRIIGIKEDSLWNDLGIDNGDLIIESGSQLIDSPQASADLLNELGSAEAIHLRIQTTEGRQRFIDWQAPAPPDPSTLPEHCR